MTVPQKPSAAPLLQGAGITPDALRGVVRSILQDRPLIVVSNREPYEHIREGDEITVRRTIGGLVTALDPLLQAVGGTWVAWGSGSADREVTDAHDGVSMPPGEDRYRLRRVWLDDEEVEKFYEGHVNQTLWPLCHLQTEKVRFLRSEWDVYQSVNRRFAQAVCEELQGREGIVWFQDYHFATAPAMARDMCPQATLLQFWHIPWPPWEIFRQHPQRRALLEGMLGCDLIGMHIDLYCDNFLDCVVRGLGVPVDLERRQIVVGDRTVRVRAFPISVDAQHIATIAADPKTERLMERLRKRYAPEGQKIGVAVERSDYTKGILLRLRALHQLFAQYPQWREKFTFIQVTPPSRGKIPAYFHFQRQMQRLIADINATFRTVRWQPIVHVQTARPQEELVALFHIADIAVVSVRQDGMNLVAKEYVAARGDEQGVLLLSEFAGAAEEMPQAVPINPYDVEGFAHAMHAALSMPPEEQRWRMRQLRQQLFDHTVYDWIRDILEATDSLESEQERGSMGANLLDHLESVRERIEKAGKVELFCDYDGVLTPIAPRPKDARLEPHVRDLLVKLRDSASVHVTVVSGRALSDVSELVSVERLTYAGNHGLEIRGPRLALLHPDAERVHDILRRLYEDVRKAMREFPGVVVENKQLSIALHYRLARPEQVPEISRLFTELVDRSNGERLLRLTTGKCLLEARPNIPWDKGKAVLWMLRELHGSDWEGSVLPMYLGDDVTDEDAFRILRRRGVTVAVSPPPDVHTAAWYRLESVADVTVFLEWLTQTIH